MSRQLKLILFVLVFNAIGFAEGYLLSDSGLVWVLPIIVVQFNPGDFNVVAPVMNFGVGLLSRQGATQFPH